MKIVAALLLCFGAMGAVAETGAPLIADINSVIVTPPQPVNIAYFDDGNERKSLNDLRRLRQSGELLSVRDKAVLEAGNRIGFIFWPNCRDPRTNKPLNGNAFLIQIDGIDAVMTSAHLIISDEGSVRHGCNLANITVARYMPNASYFEDSENPPEANSLIRFSAEVFIDERLGRIPHTGGLANEDDWIVYFPTSPDELSNQVAPDGNIRGFLKFAPSEINEDQNPIIIMGQDDRQGTTTITFQECDFVIEESTVYHLCDTNHGSSGSLLGIVVDEEVKFLGINNINSSKLSSTGDHAVPSDFRIWNRGLSAHFIFLQLSRLLIPQIEL